MYKYYEISDKNVEFIKRVKAEQRLTSEKAAINYIIDGFQKIYGGIENTPQEEIAAAVINKFSEEYGRIFTRLLSSMMQSEEIIQAVQDAINTMLIKDGIESCVLADVMSSPVLEKSKEYYRHKVSKAKQRKDNAGN